MSTSDIKEEERAHAPFEKSFDKLTSPFERFYWSQSGTGIILFISTLAALYLANSEFHDFYKKISEFTFTIALDEWKISNTLHHWVNDGFMAIFFFVLGLEIKREVLAGDLRDLKQSTLVIFMALGGMIFPAAIYAATTQSQPELNGWGIPMATDTAFALGALALLGSKAPRAAAILLSALAIVDDIGAVLVISIFYTEQVHFTALGFAAITLAIMVGFNLLGIRHFFVYAVASLILWWFILESGVHTTIAGVLAALTVPARPFAETGWFKRKIREKMADFNRIDTPEKSILEEKEQHELVEEVQNAAKKTTTPLQHWSTLLDRPVMFSIVPLFAFLNAGVEFPSDILNTVSSPTMIGIFLGLTLGKPLGISLCAWLALKFNLATLPKGLSFKQLVALAQLAGVGFTMSLFIATLAFTGENDVLSEAKLGILCGSLIAGISGLVMFLVFSKTDKSA